MHCRLWKMEGDTNIQDVEEALDSKNLPCEIQGRVLDPFMLVQDVNVADNETIILEWKISTSKDPETPYAYDPKPDVKRKALYKESNLPEELQAI